MKFIGRSLLIKLTLAFLGVGLLGIVLMAFFASRFMQLEFARYVSDSHYERLVSNLSGYYKEHGSFEGAVYLLEEERALQSGTIREYLVVNPNGDVLLSLTQQMLVHEPLKNLLPMGFPIEVENVTVGYLIPLREPPKAADVVQENMDRFTRNLLIGVGVAILLILIFAAFVAHTIIKPLRQLDEVTRAIAQGDLERKVEIRSMDEIGTLARSFNQMVSSLKFSRDLRRQMTADIAHELRNPLSIIMGNAEAILDGVLPCSPETMHILYDESRHLSRLVDDLRTLSLTESGELYLERTLTVPQDLLERCAAAFSTRAASLGVQLTTWSGQGLPVVLVDVERLQQVLANLVDNALKHSKPGGKVQLSAAVAVDGGVEFRVADDGAGIRAEDLPHIFDRFYRGKKSPKRSTDGSGLGLAITRALVELHGGKIYAESEAGQGTIMVFSLPAAV